MRIGELAELVVRRLTELGLSLDEVGDVQAGGASRDLGEILRELAQLLRQAEAGSELSEQAPVSPELTRLFDRMAHVAADRPCPNPGRGVRHDGRATR